MNSLNKKFFLHVGAHRTGSSSFQLCLQRNRGKLQNAGYGISFPSRDGVRAGELALRLPAPRHKEEDIEGFSTRMRDHLGETRVTGDRDSVILSDENIVGGMVHFEQGRFYPAAEKRLRTLYSAINGPPEHVIIVIREYASFFRSCYRKRAEQNWVKPFEEVKPSLVSMDRGWYELVRILAENLSPTSLTVVSYGNRGTSSDLLKKLVPDLVDVSITEPNRTLNVGATDAGLIALQKLHSEGKKVKRKQRLEILDRHSEQVDSLEFSEYSDAEFDQLKERFDRDLERISSIPRVSLVR